MTKPLFSPHQFVVRVRARDAADTPWQVLPALKALSTETGLLVVAEARLGDRPLGVLPELLNRDNVLGRDAPPPKVGEIEVWRGTSGRSGYRSVLVRESYEFDCYVWLPYDLDKSRPGAPREQALFQGLKRVQAATYDATCLQLDRVPQGVQLLAIWVACWGHAEGLQAPGDYRACVYTYPAAPEQDRSAWLLRLELSPAFGYRATVFLNGVESPQRGLAGHNQWRLRHADDDASVVVESDDRAEAVAEALYQASARSGRVVESVTLDV